MQDSQSLKLRDKTVEAFGGEYQIRRLPPEEGSWAYFRLLWAVSSLSAERTNVTEPTAEEVKAVEEISYESRAYNLCALAYMKLPYDDLKFLQRECTKRVSRWETNGDNRAEWPLVTSDGRWDPRAEDVRQNPALVTKLTTEVLVFSIASFFASADQKTSS